MVKTKRCSICGKPFNDEIWNDAMPFKKGKCCKECEEKFVIPSRVFSYEAKNRLIFLLVDAQNAIESGDFELDPPNCIKGGFKADESKLPYKLKHWRKNVFNRLWKWDENISYEICKLLGTFEEKGMKIINISPFTKDSEYGFHIYYGEKSTTKHTRK